jgi:hypothetical protein
MRVQGNGRCAIGCQVLARSTLDAIADEAPFRKPSHRNGPRFDIQLEPTFLLQIFRWDVKMAAKSIRKPGSLSRSYHWYRHWILNHGPCPCDDSLHGCPHKISTDETEMEIREYSAGEEKSTHLGNVMAGFLP